VHINVEWHNKTNLLKYLFKYLTKGHDVACIRFQPMVECRASVATYGHYVPLHPVAIGL
jgi:hypothetical protein